MKESSYEKRSIRRNDEKEASEKEKIIRAKRNKSITDVLEEVEVLIDTHFFDEFTKTKSSTFLKKVIENQGSIDTSLFTKTRRTLNCTPKTTKVNREI